MRYLRSLNTALFLLAGLILFSLINLSPTSVTGFAVFEKGELDSLFGINEPGFGLGPIELYTLGEEEPEQPKDLKEELPSQKEEGSRKGPIILAANDPNNYILITNKEGTTTQYPVQIGRLFKEGEITDYPQAEIDGTPLATQANIKNKWPDGSVKYAILTFYIPTLEASKTEKINFINQPKGNPGKGMTQANMIATGIDATIEISNGATTKQTSLQQMIAAGDYTEWFSGSEATSIIVTDHSTTRKYDMGFDSHRSLRPLFLVTFYPKSTPHTYRIRYIGEISNTETLQDMNYDLTLTIGTGTNKRTVYTENGVNHLVGSRWTLEYWKDDNKPNKIDLDHNLAYLRETKFYPYFDTRITVPETTIQTTYDWWNRKSGPLFSRWGLVQDMGASGGRGEIGPWPVWHTMWLYTGDARMKEVSTKMAEVAGSWPIHIREGTATRGSGTRWYDRKNTIPALGKPLSTNARPGFQMGRYNTGNSLDRIDTVGGTTRNQWRADCAHFMDPFSVGYTFTGDHYYLEQLYFWSAAAAMRASPGNNHWNRGPTGKEYGHTGGQVRGRARCPLVVLRSAYLAPDGTPEKEHHDLLIRELIAAMEGIQDLGVGKYASGSAEETIRLWSRDNARDSRWSIGGTGIPPMKHFGAGDGANVRKAEHKPSTWTIVAPWMESLILFTYGHARELGYDTNELIKHNGQYLTTLANDPDPLISALTGGFWIPASKGDRTSREYLKNNAELKAQFNPGWLENNIYNYFQGKFSDPNHGYSVMALAGLTYTIGTLPNGQSAYDFMLREAQKNSAWQPKRTENPQWAINPRPQAPRTCKAGTETRPCSKQQGVCAGATQTCPASGQWETQCDTIDYTKHNGSYEDRIELSCDDGLDNDCDGRADCEDTNCNAACNAKAPILGGIEPNPVWTGKDQTITLTGTGFEDKTTTSAPVVNGHTWGKAAYIGPNTIQFTLPASFPEGKHDIQAENAYGGGARSNTIELEVLHEAAPLIETLNPNTAAAGTEGRITLTGKNFRAGARPWVNGGPWAPAVIISATEAWFSYPKTAFTTPQTILIGLENPNGGNPKLSNLLPFTITGTGVQRQILTNISPQTIITDINNTIIVTGDRFDTTSRPIINNVTWNTITFIDTKHISFEVPKDSTPGIYDIHMQKGTNTNTRSTNSIPLHVLKPAVITGLGPTGTFPEQTKKATLTLNTDVESTCKYDSRPNTPYDAMTGTLTSTNGTTHTKEVDVTFGTKYTYHFKCEVTTTKALNTIDHSTTFNVANIIIKRNNFIRSTTNFTKANLRDIKSIILEDGIHGGLWFDESFSGKLAFLRSIDLDKNLKIGNKFIYLNPIQIPELNKNTNLFYFTKKATPDIFHPLIKRDGKKCNPPECYSSGKTTIPTDPTQEAHVFFVTGFSNYSIYEDCTDADNDTYSFNPAPICGGKARMDCNDTNPTINPGAQEICGNGIDDNCDGNPDEGCSCTQPGINRTCGTSNIGECKLGNQICQTNMTWGTCKGAIPPTREICDGKDNDCDGKIDEDCVNQCEDKDKDGYNITVTGSCGPKDCDDNDKNTNPGAKEICKDNKDNNCDGKIDEDCGGGPGGGGGSGGNNKGGSKIIQINLDDNKKHEVTIKKGTMIDMTINKQIYRLEIKGINTHYWLYFTNISKEINATELKLYTIDLDKNKKEDAELYLQKEGTKHTITLIKTKDSFTSGNNNNGSTTKDKTNKGTKTKEKPAAGFKPSKTGFWILLIGILTLIAGITWTIKGKKHQ